MALVQVLKYNLHMKVQKIQKTDPFILYNLVLLPPQEQIMQAYSFPGQLVLD